MTDKPSIRPYSPLSSKKTGVALLLTGSLFLSACGGGGSGDSGDTSQSAGACADFDCPEMLRNLSDKVMLPAMKEASDQAASLETAVTAYQQAPADEALRDAARVAWEDAMGAWQSVEIMQVGPLTDNSSLVRDSIYSWPSTNTCVVDQEIIEAEKADYDIAARTPLRKGFDALEYVLYTPTLDHSCPAATDATQGWNDRPDDERRAARLNYAIAAAGDIDRLTTNLLSEWNNGFRDELVNAGSSGSRFDSEQAAVNAVSDALFYIEKQVKDIKLAEPLGLKGDKCQQGAADCADAVENQLSARSKEHIRQNLVSFQRLFLGNSADGTNGQGFDDLIDSASGDNVSANMEAAIDETLAALDALDTSLQTAVTDPNGVELAEGIHESSKKITDRLKNDFLTVLGLSIPKAAAGDGD